MPQKLLIISLTLLHLLLATSPMYFPSSMAGYWYGTVKTPWVDPYRVELIVLSSGQYSCHQISNNVHLPCLYYGSDHESPNKQITLNRTVDNKYYEGTIKIFWDHDTYGTTTNGEITNLIVDKYSLAFTFNNILNNKRYGPIYFDLKKLDKIFEMCPAFCVKTVGSVLFGTCNFTTSRCSYKDSNNIPSSSYPHPYPIPSSAIVIDDGSMADVKPNYTWLFIVICLVAGLLITAVVIGVIGCVRKRHTTTVSVEYLGEMTGPSINQDHLSTVELEPVFVRTNVQN